MSVAVVSAEEELEVVRGELAALDLVVELLDLGHDPAAVVDFVEFPPWPERP